MRVPFSFSFFILTSFLIVFGLGWFSAQKTQTEQKKAFLKVQLKAEALSQISRLNTELYALNKSLFDFLKEIEIREIENSIVPDSNKPYLLPGILDKNPKKASIKKLDELSDQAKNLSGFFDSIDRLFVQLLIFDKEDLSLPLYTMREEDPDLFQALNLEDEKSFLFPQLSSNDSSSSSPAYFKKIKRRGKTYPILLQAKGRRIIVAFLKNSYFNLSAGKTSGKNLSQKQNKNQGQAEESPWLPDQFKSRFQKKIPAKALFAIFDKNHNRFFYNTSIKDSAKLVDLFFKDSSSKYITRKSKKNQVLYYLQEWKGANLLLIAKKEIPLSFFDILIGEGNQFLWLVSLALLLLVGLMFIFYFKLAGLFQAYDFLKSSVISYSKVGPFLKDSSKNPFLAFYRNRWEILKPAPLKDSNPQETACQLKDLVKKEIEKLKLKYPHLILKEDFQTDIKMFGFQNFFRTIFNELLLNATQSMGSMKEQKIDLLLKEEDQHLILSIKDYGSGLKEHEKAFEIYYSTKSQLGAGLNLVQSIVVANQGEIELIPQEEGGLLALVRLPLSCFLKK